MTRARNTTRAVAIPAMIVRLVVVADFEIESESVGDLKGDFRLESLGNLLAGLGFSLLEALPRGG